MNIRIELTTSEVHFLRRTLAQGYSGSQGKPDGVRSALLDKISAADAITRGIPIKADFIDQVRADDDGEEKAANRKRARKSIFRKRV